MRLEGKVAVVTGVARRGSAAPLLSVWDAREPKLWLPISRPTKRETLPTNFTHWAPRAIRGGKRGQRVSVKRLANATFDRFGRDDILVNDAGVYLKSSVVEMSEDLWDRTIDVNLGEIFFVRGLLSRHAKAKEWADHQHRLGRCALRCEGIRPYAASKAAIIGFVKALAREVGTDGITVNAICPGAANTAMPRTHRTEEELMARLRSNPLGHVLEPEDFVGPILFLASDAASYITGQAINVNCGSYMI